MATKDRAVVLGGSVAGLLAVRALAGSYREVVLVERDPLPAGTSTAPRTGVPHGRHAHGLLVGGLRAIETLLPGATADLAEAGVPAGDMCGAIRLYADGHPLRQGAIGELGLAVSRPFLESYVRTRVLDTANLKVIDGCDVAGLDSTDGVVTGARIHRRSAGAGEETVAADLVVDATGRGSRTPRWLGELGYAPPVEERLEVNLSYTTRKFKMAPDGLGGNHTVIVAPSVTNPRGGVLQVVEQGRAVATVFGILGDAAPGDLDGFLAFAKTLRAPEFDGILRAAEPIDEPATFRFPASVRRRYERLDRFPAGLLVIGDAICSFNPQYAQGMSVSAMEAATLLRMAPDGVTAPAFFRAVAPIIDVPWQIVTGSDLAHPGVQGERTGAIRFVNAYLRRLQAAARRDATLTEAFARVVNLIAAPRSLMRPDRAVRVLVGGRAAR
ncbi:FAD-dependent oxidoreductase [Polymorphospora rubra]|uniref:FAD-dependent oxidoreductase n=1 Tax=Polymorphospora rubra TaxID=338584 RepID=UPI0033D11552